MKEFKTMWVVLIKNLPAYATSTREKAMIWLEDYIRYAGLEKEEMEKLLEEIKTRDLVGNPDFFCSIDAVSYED